MIYIIVCVFILFDIGSGILKALHIGDINSTKLRKGLYHKIAELMILFGAGFLEYSLHYFGYGNDIPILKGVATYICATELVSVIENISMVSPTLGNFLEKYFDKINLKEGNDDKGN